MAESKYDIAVVMPVRNESAFLGQTLDQIYHQDYPMEKVEVVVAEGCSTDNTREIALGFKGRFGSLKVLDNTRCLPSSGRNVGVKNTTAPYIIVIDGHTHLPSKDILADMVQLFESTGAHCLCRPQPLMPPDINEFERSVAICRSSSLGHKPGSEIYADDERYVDPTSSGAMYRREVFERIGYFDEEFDACEDVDFNYRVHIHGMKAFLSPKLAVCYYPRSSLRGLWRQMVRYGQGRHRFSLKHGVFSPIQWLAAAGVAGFALLLLLALASSAAREVFTTVTGLYMLLIIFFSFYLAVREKQLGCLLYGPVIFPAIHFGLGWGYLSGIIQRLMRREREPL